MTSRRMELIQRYGIPQQLTSEYAITGAIAHMDTADDLHPGQVVVMVYPSQEAADAFAAANLEQHGHPTVGTYEAPDGSGIVGVLDIRAAIAEADAQREANRLRSTEGIG